MAKKPVLPFNPYRNAPETDLRYAVGVLTDRDIALAVADRGATLGRTAVGELMSRDVVTIAASAPLAEALRTFEDRRVRVLLAVDAGGVLRGVLSWTDLAGHVSEAGLGGIAAKIARLTI